MSKNQEKFLLASQKLFAVPNITPFDLSFKQYDDKSLKKVKERALGEMELYRKSPLGQLFQQFYQHESEVLNKFIMSIMLYFQAFYEQRIFQNDMITMKDKKNPSLAAKKMIAHMRDPGREGRIKDCLDRYFMMASQAYFIVVIHACFAETHGQRYSDQVMQCFFKDLLDYTIYFCIEVIPSLREKGFDAEIRKELNNIMGSRMPQIGDKTMNADTDEGQSKLNASSQQQEQSGDLEVMMEKEKEKAKQREREKQQKKRAAEAHPLLDFAASNSPLLAVALANWSDDNQSNTSDNQQQNQSQNKANQNELTQKQSIDSNQQQLTPDHSESPSQSVYFNESYLDQMNWWNFKDLEIANVMKIADNAKRLMQGKKLKLFDEKDVDNQDQGLAEQDSDVIRRNKEVTNREQSPEGVNEENKTNQLQQSDNMNNTPPYQYEKNDMYIFRESHNLQRQYLKKKQGELNKLKKILSEKEYLKPIKPPFRTVENIINRANFFSPESDELTGRSGEEEMERMNIEYQRIVQTELEQMEVEKDIDKVALVERAWEKTEAEEKEALEMKKQQQILKNQSKVDSEFKSGDMDEGSYILQANQSFAKFPDIILPPFSTRTQRIQRFNTRKTRMESLLEQANSRSQRLSALKKKQNERMNYLQKKQDMVSKANDNKSYQEIKPINTPQTIQHNQLVILPPINMPNQRQSQQNNQLSADLDQSQSTKDLGSKIKSVFTNENENLRLLDKDGNAMKIENVGLQTLFRHSTRPRIRSPQQAKRKDENVEEQKQTVLKEQITDRSVQDSIHSIKPLQSTQSTSPSINTPQLVHQTPKILTPTSNQQQQQFTLPKLDLHQNIKKGSQPVSHTSRSEIESVRSNNTSIPPYQYSSSAIAFYDNLLSFQPHTQRSQGSYSQSTHYSSVPSTSSTSRYLFPNQSQNTTFNIQRYYPLPSDTNRTSQSASISSSSSQPTQNSMPLTQTSGLLSSRTDVMNKRTFNLPTLGELLVSF